MELLCFQCLIEKMNLDKSFELMIDFKFEKKNDLSKMLITVYSFDLYFIDRGKIISLFDLSLPETLAVFWVSFSVYITPHTVVEIIFC